MSKLKFFKRTYIAAAGVSFLLSVYLWFNGSRDEGVFVGIWVPSILSLGALILGGLRNREVGKCEPDACVHQRLCDSPSNGIDGPQARDIFQMALCPRALRSSSRFACPSFHK